MDKYSADYSTLTTNVLEESRRMEVAEQIVAVLTHFLKKRKLKKLRCLDIGASSGVIANRLADHFQEVVAIDIDRQAAKEWRKYDKKNLVFRMMSGLDIRYKSGTFDVVILNQVYEFVPDPERLMHEVHKVLKPHGACFFGARNKLSIMEGQYNLPFLSWLPGVMSRLYLHIIGRKSYFLADYMTLWQLRSLCGKFKITDYTIDIIKHPCRYQYRRLERYASLVNVIPNPVFVLLKPFIPNYIWLLTKTT